MWTNTRLRTISSLFDMMEDSDSGSGSGSGSGLLPSKRQRTLTPKGKEKMEEANIEEEAICGICLLGGGLKVRGQIDCCDHYFCFVCIMEWAKVESRCPMCKQRFHFIRRPEVSGQFASESVLEIPVRDQVYHPLGNESSALSDPYAQVNCRVCHGTDHDELLLLCDLCDSASHTYCVSLGYTVPEDNWYCHDCTIIREEQAKVDLDSDDSNQNKDTHALDQQQPVSVFDIVTDERFFPTEQLPSQQFNEISMSRSSTTQQRISEGLMLNVEQSECVSSPSGSNSHLQLKVVRERARTLQHSRNIHVRIHSLRKNWNALRSGSLIFSSVLDSNDDMMSGTKQMAHRTNSDLLQESKSTTLVNNDQLTDSNNSRNTSSINELQAIKRAWKMMQKAKTSRLSKASSSLNMVSKNKIALDKVVSFCTPGAYKQLPIQAVHGRHEPIGFCQKFQPSNQPKNGNRLAAKTSSSMQFSFSRKNRLLTKEFVGRVKEVLPIQHSSNVSVTTCSSLSRTTCEVRGELPLDRRAAASICINRTSKWNGNFDNNAKSEIQSMVKLNLMLLSKGGCLGTQRFKEIARASTHSILAACGLEHSKSHARHFSNKVCRHTKPMQGLHSSTFMPGSCRDCFDSFVKDVVNSILLEKSTSSISG